MRREMEMMRILRVPPMGKMVVEIQKHRFEKLSELEGDEKAIRIINAAIGELVSFAGGYQALVDAGVAPELSTSGPARDAVTLSAKQAAFLAQLEAEQEALRQPKVEEVKIPEKLTIAPRPVKAVTPEQKTLTVVEQIDVVLQRLVKQTPEFNGRSLNIIQNPAGGVSIDVDGKRYPSPDAVKDPIAKALVKKAVAEWEAA